MAANRPWTDAERRVWNRALYQEGTDLRDGDLALGELLHVDGYIQNGGVGHASDLAPEELARGIKGYEFFGFHELAAVIKPHRDDEEADYNHRYYRFTRGENMIIKKYQQMFAEHPERFAPLDKPTAR